MTPEFSINKKTYTFGDITLRKYLALQPYTLEETTDNCFQIVSIVTDCPVEELRKLNFKDWNIIWNECLFHLSFNTSADNIRPVFKFKDIEYSLPQVDDLTIGEFIDLDLILQNQKSDSRLNEVAAILYRPVIGRKEGVVLIEPYDPKIAKGRAELFMDLPIAFIRSANAFFLTSANSLQKNLLGSSSLPELMKLLPQEDQDLVQNLLQQELGGLSLTEFQDQIHSILLRQPDSQPELFSTSWLTKKLNLRKQNSRSKKLKV